MHKGNQFGGALGGHDPGDLSRDERVALRQRRLPQRALDSGGRCSSASARAARSVTALAPTSTIVMEPSSEMCEGFGKLTRSS